MLKKYFLLFFLVFTTHHLSYSKDQPRAVNGIIDISDMDLNQDFLITLDGEWDFFWEQYLGPDSDIDQSEPLSITVPGAWNTHFIQGKYYPDQGYATYRLRVITGSYPDLVLGLKFPNMINAYTVYINGETVAQNGQVGTNKETNNPKWIPRTAYFRFTRTTNEILIHVGNFRYIDGGIQTSLNLGSQHRISARQDFLAGWDNFLFGVFIIMGMYHLGLFLLRKEDLSTLYFGLFSFFVGLRTFVTGERVLLALIPAISWDFGLRMEFFTMPLTGIFFILYIRTLFPEEANKKIIFGLSALHAVYFLICMFTPTYFFSSYLLVFHIVLLVTIAVVIITLIRAGIKGREGAWMVIGGFAALVITIINDILFVNNVIFTGHLLPYGVFAFIFSQAFILSIRFSMTYRKLAEMKDKLNHYNQTLTELVQSRTTELEKERNTLKKRNETIESELDLARRIQMDLIPSVSYYEHLYFYYKPMEKVGGDFYDFIPYPDPDIMGIFISDVSGHGVPAALVTSMLKSTLLQIAPGSMNPAAVLSSLNDALHNKTAGNFVTAFYGILNTRTREFTYSNAGHNCPFVIHGESIFSLLNDTQGMPLSILTNEELRDSNKQYKNSLIQLNPKSKLFFYTDGLMEAVNKRKPESTEMEEYQDRYFIQTVEKIKDLPCQFFIAEMSQSLIDFRGSDDFDDDVCMICVDL